MKDSLATEVTTEDSGCVFDKSAIVTCIGKGNSVVHMFNLLEILFKGMVLSRQFEDGALGVGEFFVAAVVATVIDECLGGGEVVLRGFPRVRLPRKKRRAR